MPEKTEEFILRYTKPGRGVYEVSEQTSGLSFTGTSRADVRAQMIDALTSWDGEYRGACQPVSSEEKVFIVRRTA